MIEFKNAREFIGTKEENLLIRWANYGSFCLSKVPKDGLCLEFGVASGDSAKEIISYLPDARKLYGFDWFYGLPEDWKTSEHHTHRKGTTFGATPGTVPEIKNLEIVNGLFEQTVPHFFKNNKQNIAFMHIDCDLYESTRIVFEHAAPFIVPGTIIMFDEIHGYPNYHEHEYKAWMEFVAEYNINFEWIAYRSGNGQEAACIIC